MNTNNRPISPALPRFRCTNNGAQSAVDAGVLLCMDTEIAGLVCLPQTGLRVFLNDRDLVVFDTWQDDIDDDENATLIAFSPVHIPAVIKRLKQIQKSIKEEGANQ